MTDKVKKISGIYQSLLILIKDCLLNAPKREKILDGTTTLLGILAVVSGFVTYIFLTNTDITNTADSRAIYWLLNVNVLILLLMGGFVARRVVKIWIQRRSQQAGSSLHVKLVLLFSLLTAIPAVLMTLFSLFFFELGVQTWFGDKISTAITESQSVAQAYLKEHQQTIKADVLAMASDLDRNSAILLERKNTFQEFVQTQARLRNLTEAYVFDSSGYIITSGGLSVRTDLLGRYSDSDIEQARAGDVVLMVDEESNRVHALMKLNNFIDTYLMAGRLVEEGVLNHVSMTGQAADNYTALKEQQNSLRLILTLVYALVALLLIMASVWAGLWLAGYLVRPLSELINAANRVSSGDLNARVAIDKRNDEAGILGSAFNRMTDQLSKQRQELMSANLKLDQRRRFTEAVLSGVSAGVMSVDQEGVVVLANKSAQKLFNIEEKEQMIGQALGRLSREMETLRRALRRNPDRLIDTEIKVPQTAYNTEQTWVVRMSCDIVEEGDTTYVSGYVITFDNITPLQNAQRKAAWSDVARRIAHEIKNPLTPIQLSAERLQKKYRDFVPEDDRERFETFIDTIVRQVSTIGTLIDEFSAFARMPQAQKKEEDLITIIKQSTFLFSQAHPEIEFILIPNREKVIYACDAQQITQMLTNLMKNAVEAIDKEQKNGRISIDLTEESEQIILSIQDNGCGLPDNIDSSELLNPYVTHRENGTGLGLAIVAKIVEDHNGELLIENAPDKGAKFTIILPKDQR